MTLISNLRDTAVITAVLLLGVLPAAAQTSPIEASASPTSIGFENPSDISNLLEYRLPDWGWRTWDLEFDLSGGGSDVYYEADDRTFGNNFNSRLGTTFNLYRESERRDWNTYASAFGGYHREHQGTSTSETSGHTLNTYLGAGGNLREYLGGGPVFIRAGGNAAYRYEEQIYERQSSGGETDQRNFRRSTALAGRAGVGLGRVRDVTPLIRAQRLSERLVALGRPALTRGQVLEVASVLATEEGYRMVFDRPDRSFWRDTLEPMLDPDNPLSPYEIFYLRDVMSEDIGPRTQGASIQVLGLYDEARSNPGDTEFISVRRSVGLAASWDHNLSLNHQLRATGSLDFGSVSSSSRKAESWGGHVSLDYLWTIADRYRWDNLLTFRTDDRDLTSSVDHYKDRSYVTNLGSEFRIFVEDKMAVVASVTGENRQQYLEPTEASGNEDYWRAWSWTYGIGLEYRLDSFLY